MAYCGRGLLEKDYKMATMKRVLIILVLCLIPALARADSFVQVVMNPTILPEVLDTNSAIPLPGGGGFTLTGYTESLGATFTWDTTTNLLSDIKYTATGGPFFQNMVQGYTSMPYTLNFVNGAGDIFQMNSGNHAG
jgi:hypothetical protein